MVRSLGKCGIITIALLLITVRHVRIINRQVDRIRDLVDQEMIKKLVETTQQLGFFDQLIVFDQRLKTSMIAGYPALRLFAGQSSHAGSPNKKNQIATLYLNDLPRCERNYIPLESGTLLPRQRITL